MARKRYNIEDIAVVNGWTIQRDRHGSSSTYLVRKFDADGYVTDRGTEVSYKREAVAFAETH
jgi:hypothetical protein